jgi:hypothetical protein
VPRAMTTLVWTLFPRPLKYIPTRFGLAMLRILNGTAEIRKEMEPRNPKRHKKILPILLLLSTRTRRFQQVQNCRRCRGHGWGSFLCPRCKLSFMSTVPMTILPVLSRGPSMRVESKNVWNPLFPPGSDVTFTGRYSYSEEDPRHVTWFMDAMFDDDSDGMDTTATSTSKQNNSSQRALETVRRQRGPISGGPLMRTCQRRPIPSALA